MLSLIWVLLTKTAQTMIVTASPATGIMQGAPYVRFCTRNIIVYNYMKIETTLQIIAKCFHR